ncbi:MAG: DNA-processing protein DprA [Burkholderiaceae bacterium]|nr:DNA-processing protein DprA [Burkholderiaceae bacterium]
MSTRLSTEEVTAWIRLSLEPDLGPAQARNLLAAVGLPQDIYALSSSALQKYLPADMARQLKAAAPADVQDTIAKTLDWLQDPRHHLLTLADPAYPPVLLDIHDPPLVLYANGNLDALQRPALAIVGARSATPAGTDNALAFAKHLAAQGWCIISGLALGIDTAAHEGALLAGGAGATIAVMGTGMDIVYPARNRLLAHQIAEHGLLLSEFPLGTRALPWQFPKRNRIVAGLSKGVLVVEAARQSGSLITARMASDMGREVFAIPGSIHSPLSRGCHALIRQGAKLVESAQDISDELGLPIGVVKTPLLAPQSATPPLSAPSLKQPQTSAPISDAPGYATLMTALGHDPVDADTLRQRTNLDTGALQALLLQLELANHITQLPDGRYQRRLPQLI